MKNDQSLFDVIAKELFGIKEVLKKEKPDMVLVQGDTTTSFIAALTSFYLRIPVGRVKVGLRTILPLQKGSAYQPKRGQAMTEQEGPKNEN